MSHQATTTHPVPAARPHRRRWAALAFICVAQFMLILDVTVVNVALPALAADLRLDREALTWVVTAYTLVFGGLMLLGGRLADAFGARRLMLTGLAVFTLASLASGLAGDGALLVAGRVAQGAGAALLSPAALAVVTTTFHGAERDRALGVWAALGGLGAAAGVLVGGALTAGPGWRWVFFVNVPVGVAVLIALPLTVPAAARASGRARVDLPGALLVTGATAALIYAVVKAGDGGWNGTPTLAALAVSAVLYLAFALVERAARVPLMDLRMLTRRPVVAGAFLMLAATALLIALFFLGSVYLQDVRGLSPLATGLTFLPVAVATGVGAHLAGRLVGVVGGRLVGAAGLALAAAGAWLLTGLSSGDDIWTGLVPGFVLGAAGAGATLVAATTTAFGFVSHHEAGLASGIVNTFHEVGGSLGVAVVSTLAAAGIEHKTLAGYDTVFAAGAVAAAVAAVAAFAVIPAGRPHRTGGAHVH
uniref:MFS transporter n=1 Tax=Nonomuraea pusilla TaxID=46177 RepID=UPI0006E3D9E4|nr:MFS transporter [Nonomuraea pusilla]